MARTLIKRNRRAVGADVADAAIEKIDNDSKKKTNEKGGEENEKKTTRRKNTRTGK